MTGANSLASGWKAVDFGVEMRATGELGIVVEWHATGNCCDSGETWPFLAWGVPTYIKRVVQQETPRRIHRLV